MRISPALLALQASLLAHSAPVTSPDPKPKPSPATLSTRQRANTTTETAAATTTTCTAPRVAALTFDDGPHAYTAHILDLLAARGAHATFFVNGDNFGRGAIDDPATPWPATLRRMVAAGHQVGSHTWSHKDLSGGGDDGGAARRDEMERLADALDDVLGLRPRYMRPPYGSCDAACLADMAAMGYHVIDWSLDTKDYAHDSPDAIQESMDAFSDGFRDGSSPIVLVHDVHEQTAYALTEFMLDALDERGYAAVTVGECLGDPRENWYYMSEDND